MVAAYSPLAGQHAAQLLVVLRVVILLGTRPFEGCRIALVWLVQQDGCHGQFSYVSFRTLVRPWR